MEILFVGGPIAGTFIELEKPLHFYRIIDLPPLELRLDLSQEYDFRRFEILYHLEVLHFDRWETKIYFYRYSTLSFEDAFHQLFVGYSNHCKLKGKEEPLR